MKMKMKTFQQILSIAMGMSMPTISITKRSIKAITRRDMINMMIIITMIMMIMMMMSMMMINMILNRNAKEENTEMSEKTEEMKKEMVMEAATTTIRLFARQKICM